jgi:hypothetical protein
MSLKGFGKKSFDSLFEADGNDINSFLIIRYILVLVELTSGAAFLNLCSGFI